MHHIEWFVIWLWNNKSILELYILVKEGYSFSKKLNLQAKREIRTKRKGSKSVQTVLPSPCKNILQGFFEYSNWWFSKDAIHLDRFSYD